MDNLHGEHGLDSPEHPRSPVRSMLLAFLLAFFSVLLPHDGLGLRLDASDNVMPLSRHGLDKTGSGLQPILDARSEIIRKVQAPRPAQKPVWLAGGADAALLPELPRLGLSGVLPAYVSSRPAISHGAAVSPYWSRAPPLFLFFV